MREDLRVRFGDCSSSPLVRFRVLLLAVGVPRCGRPVVRDIPSGFVATSALEIEVSSRYFLFLVLPPFFVSVMPDRYSHCVLTPTTFDTFLKPLIELDNYCGEQCPVSFIFIAALRAWLTDRPR